MHYLILTRDPRGPRVQDGFEWREWPVQASDDEWLQVCIRHFEERGYTQPDSLRVERVEEAKGAKP